MVNDVQTVIVQVNRKLENENNHNITLRVRDILEAVEVVKTTNGMQYLTETIKTTLSSGICELISILRLLAFDFYKVNQFEPTEEIIPVMRGVVSEALAKGVI